MFFQSYGFIFLFLPALLGGLALATRFGATRRHVTGMLIVASLIFYGQLSPRSLPFLLLSYAANFLFCHLVQTAKASGTPGLFGRTPGFFAGVGVTFHIAALVVFKCSTELGWSHFPIGASFVTFIHIMLLVEILNGTLDRIDATEHLLVSTFFPYVTSGPLVGGSEIVSQVRTGETTDPPRFERVVAGAMLFAIGLFKKLLVADSLGPYASRVFDIAQSGRAMTSHDAWCGSLAYMFQLYFDFSGYSDMAVAIGYMVGIKLPLNFNSPFKATTVLEYWQRWHMTLTRFITQYLYLPIAIKATRWADDRGIESESLRFVLTVLVPTIVAFAIAGVWHGNGWTFALYGLYWGAALSVFHTWKRAFDTRLPRPVAWLLTMLTALGSLVIFRSESVAASARIMKAAFSPSAASAESVASSPLPAGFAFILAAIGAAVVILPNSQQILHRYAVSRDDVEPHAGLSWLAWRPTTVGAIGLAVVLTVSLLMASGPQQFLYYKF
ncbi:MBOAT family O-acyltransferase [Pendulispora albinea]|uniref:Uncharacterized protein n=1 Tax=Pendulispora albinea TaxID=2741071 RepID=A0ABZ2MA99_9BACT